MLVELVRTRCEDDVRLDGALQRPEKAAGDNRVVLAFHGVGGNFYGSTLFDELASSWLEQGMHVLRVNTRGHDGFSFGSGSKRRLGAAFEIVDECRRDVAAWIEFAAARGFNEIFLAGHSLGAIKAIYSLAFDQPPNVRGLIAMSPPRLSHAAFQYGEQSATFFQDLATAEELVQAGRGSDLFAARVPFPILISAECYIDKYGPKERYNILRYVDRLSCPTLFTYGSLELEKGGVAFAGLPEAIGQRQLPEQQMDVRQIPGADHMYTAVRPALAECIRSWLQYV